MGAQFDAFGFAFLRFAVAAVAFSPFLKVRRFPAPRPLVAQLRSCCRPRLPALHAAACRLLPAAGEACCSKHAACPSQTLPTPPPPPPPLPPRAQAASRDRRILGAGVEIGLWTAVGYITQSAGLLTTDASRASFLSTFTVLVVPLLAGLSGRGVSAVTWASCVAALVGVGLLEQGGAPPGVGDVWSMLSAIAFGLQVRCGGGLGCWVCVLCMPGDPLEPPRTMAAARTERPSPASCLCRSFPPRSSAPSTTPAPWATPATCR